MKYRFLILFCTCFSISSTSQTIFYDQIGGDGPAFGLIVVDNYLYTGAYQGGFIGRFDLDSGNPQLEVISSNFLQNSPYSLTYYPSENALYISSIPPALTKLSLSQNFPADSEIVNISPNGYMNGLVIQGDTIYAAIIDGGIGYIYQMNLELGPSSFEILYQDTGHIYNLESFNSELYFIGVDSQVDLFKIDPNDSNPTKSLVASNISPVFIGAIHIVNNYLFVGTDIGQIMRFDLNLTPPVAPVVLYNDLDGNVVGLANNDDQLFVSVGGTGIIYTFTDPILSTPPLGISEISIFPNPVNEVLYVQNETEDKINYTLYDVRGKEIRNSEYEDSGVNVENLSAGLYFINLEVSNQIQTLKFIKE